MAMPRAGDARMMVSLIPPFTPARRARLRAYRRRFLEEMRALFRYHANTEIGIDIYVRSFSPPCAISERDGRRLHNETHDIFSADFRFFRYCFCGFSLYARGRRRRLIFAVCRHDRAMLIPWVGSCCRIGFRLMA